MKETLRNFLEGYDEVVAAYCKDWNETGSDDYNVVFHQDGGGAFSISATFTSEELAKAFDSWDFIEEWQEVSRKNLTKVSLTGGNIETLGIISDAIDKAWKEIRGTED